MRLRLSQPSFAEVGAGAELGNMDVHTYKSVQNSKYGIYIDILTMVWSQSFYLKSFLRIILFPCKSICSKQILLHFRVLGGKSGLNFKNNPIPVYKKKRIPSNIMVS